MSLHAVLEGLDLPTEVRDGDCLVWAPRITAAALAHGLDAALVWVHGWVDVHGREVLVSPTRPPGSAT